MKTVIASIVGIALLVFGVTTGIRWFSAATTSVTIVTPKPGIECALASTADGAALSCWKVTP